MSVAVALTIAGSDSGGGAGIQADLKTFAALGVYGTSALTALTAQNTRGVAAIHDVPPAFVLAQLEAVLADFAVGAVKVGMVSNRAVVETVAAALARLPAVPLVLDPVMVASSGDRLLAPDAVAALRGLLIPRAAVLTPNLPEAAALLGAGVATSENEAREQGERLLGHGASAVLMKGGHAGGPESVDLLVEPERVTRFPAPRIATTNTHGTGCTLSAAIAAGLAQGRPLGEAVAVAKGYVTAAIAGADRLGLVASEGPPAKHSPLAAHGPPAAHGPLHHFHRWWDLHNGGETPPRWAKISA